MTHPIALREIKPQPVLVLRTKTTREGIAGEPKDWKTALFWPLSS